ncbi:DUF4411 family protein [Limisphaera sp. VF-2]|jgi:hypothetical protein|uniref:DUF4411 family protein n=1 Tax=Limisphaera sp. VF-2 TaxID=3400418 RepID=UPI00177011DC
MYSVDTSALMDWQARFYPTDVFVRLKERMEALIAAGKMRAPAIVREELNAVGPPALITWAKQQTRLFVPMAESLQAEARAIQDRYPELADAGSPHESYDPWVIALAKLNKWTVVSQETSANEKRRPARTYYIPDVCRDLGIPCINLLGLMRKERWTF